MYKGEREKLLHSNIIDINCLASSVIDFQFEFALLIFITAVLGQFTPILTD